MWDLKIDPETLDLSFGDDGDVETVETAESAVILQACCHEGLWFGDKTLGNRLHRMRTGGAAEVKREWERAFGVLVTDGLISDLSVETETPAPGKVYAQTSFYDSIGSKAIELRIQPGKVI